MLNLIISLLLIIYFYINYPVNDSYRIKINISYHFISIITPLNNSFDCHI